MSEGGYTIENWQIEQARVVQKKLLPSKIPDWNCLSFAYEYHSLDLIGGDYLDFFDIKGNKKGLLIADVSGHGVPAAIITALAKMSFSNHADASDSPREIFQKVNADIYKLLGDSGLYITAFFMIIDQNLKVKYSSAGHPPVIYFNNENNEFTNLKTKGLFIGMFEDAWETYEEGEIQLKAGDRVVLYTDGVIEAKNEKGEQYGIKSIENTVEFSLALSSEKLSKMLINDVKNFAGKAPITDDISILVLDVALKYNKFKQHYMNGKELFNKNNLEWVKEYEKAMEFNKDNYDTSFHLGEYYFQENNINKAEEYFSRLIYNKILNPDLYLLMAQVYIQQKRYIKAISHLKEILKVYPNFKEVLQHLGFCYFSMGKMDKAHEIYKDLKAKYPHDENTVIMYNLLEETMKKL